MNDDMTCPNGQEPRNSVPPPTCDEHPTMSDWAKREIDLLLEREKKGAEECDDPEGFEYVKLCAESALKAFNHLMEDGHSGLSISITRGLLDRLIKCQPLTPVTDEDSEWIECPFARENGKRVFQHRRCGSLFKMVYPDGKTKYSQNERFVCYEIDNQTTAFQFGLVDRILETYPEIPKITFPYMPPAEPFRVEVKDIVYDETSGDLDTIGIYNVHWKDDEGKPKQLLVNRYFDVSGNEPVEIDLDEWVRRYNAYEKIVRKREQERKSKETV